MHAWIKFACVVLAWTILPAGVLTAGPGRSARPVQVSTRTTSISLTSARVASAPALTAVASAASAPAATAPTRTYVVQRGDTLSGIATRFGVPGGWPALYAANRRRIGPDPGRVDAGLRLTIPRPATTPASGSAPAHPAPGRPQPHTHPASPAPSSSAPAPSASPSPTAPARPRPHAARSMPAWLKIMLLAVGLLAALIFAAEPLLAARRRRRRRSAVPAAPPQQPAAAAPPAAPPPATATPSHPASPHPPASPLPPASPVPPARRAPEETPMPISTHPARILIADHDRVVITRNKADDTICVLRPPGGNPADILKVARLILPEGPYGTLAEHLGLSANWPMR